MKKFITIHVLTIKFIVRSILKHFIGKSSLQELYKVEWNSFELITIKVLEKLIWVCKFHSTTEEVLHISFNDCYQSFSLPFDAITRHDFTNAY